MHKLSDAVRYSTKKIDADEVSLHNFVSTDNLLQNKGGVTLATSLPPGNSSMSAFECDEVLVSNIRPYLKKIWFSNKSGGCSADVLVFEVFKDYNPKFIYYCLFRDDFFDHMMRGAKGTKMPRGDKNQIMSFLIPSFELDSQEKIVAVLSSLDNKIELNNLINTELEAMAKTLYDYWFVQFDFPDANGKPYKTSGGKMVYNVALKREIPEGWEVSELRNLVDVVKGNISPADILPTTPYVGLEHIGRKTIVLSDWTTSDTASSDKTVFKKHDILFGKIRPYFHKVAVALFDGITSTDTILLRPKKSEYFGLALETVFTEKFVNTATSSSTGSKMPRADWNVLQHYKIPVPDLPLLQNYQELFDKMLAKIEISVIESRKLTLLRDWLLPMLMNGQVVVANKVEI